MKIIKKGNLSNNVAHLLRDHRLSWIEKGIYMSLIYQRDQSNFDPIEFSTHARDGVQVLKQGLKKLEDLGYLVINNKLLIIRAIHDYHTSLVKIHHANDMVTKSENRAANEMLRNQWLIIWHHDDAKVTQALNKLARYLNPEMVLYGIEYSKHVCHSYRESLPYLNRLIMKWKRHRLTSVGQAQRWMNQQKLNSKPWNSEIQTRIFGSRQRRTLNNTPLKRQIPDVFKNHHSGGKK